MSLPARRPSNRQLRLSSREAQNSLCEMRDDAILTAQGIDHIAGVAGHAMDVAVRLDEHRRDHLALEPGEAVRAILAEIELTAVRGIKGVQQRHAEGV